MPRNKTNSDAYEDNYFTTHKNFNLNKLQAWHQAVTGETCSQSEHLTINKHQKKNITWAKKIHTVEQKEGETGSVK